MSMRAVITYIIYAFTLYRSNNEFDSIWMGIYEKRAMNAFIIYVIMHSFVAQYSKTSAGDWGGWVNSGKNRTL